MSTSTSPIPAVSGTNAAATGNVVPANMQINEGDFLRLISSQLQNQDPMQPTDPSQFLGQLEGLSEVSSLQSMQAAMSSSQVTNGASLLGHSVLAPGTSATLAAGGVIAGAVNAPLSATSLTVTIALPSPFVATLAPGKHHLFLTGVSQRGLNGNAEAILDVQP